jgi:hypothetical protein
MAQPLIIKLVQEENLILLGFELKIIITFASLMKRFRTNSQERLVTPRRNGDRLDSDRSVRERRDMSDTLNELQRQSQTDIGKLHFRYS